MLHGPGQSLAIEFDQHRIEPHAARQMPVFGKPPQRRAPQPACLVGIDGFERSAVVIAVARLHLDDDHLGPVAAHQVQLPERRSLITGKDAVPSFGQERGSQLLAQPAPGRPVDGSVSASIQKRLLGYDRIHRQDHDSGGTGPAPRSLVGDCRGAVAKANPQHTSAGPRDIARFQAQVWAYYRENARDLPWRRTRDPYAILVSEVMLQQTQVPRVVPKYPVFMRAFPNIAALAAAPPSAVLSEWQGLGYNRRALALHRTAAIVQRDRGGTLPESSVELERLPGIGRATAAAVCVYAYDRPLPFIETNIRSAFIHFFFGECTRVSDADILPLVESTLDHDHPRDWYYALMDYGTWVKKTYSNPGRRSEHHMVQTAFAGSRRQARATALRVLLAAAPKDLSPREIMQAEALLGGRGEADVLGILGELQREGFLVREADRFRIA